MAGRWWVLAILQVSACAGPAWAPPPTMSRFVVQTVTYACVPLRAELIIDGTNYLRGLFLDPDCPAPDAGLAACYDPPDGHDPCVFACPHLTYWKQLGGTAPMHVFPFPVVDDGTTSGPLTVHVHLNLSTLDGVIVWEGDRSEDLPVLSDHRAGYFHEGLMEIRLDYEVWQVLGRNCL